MVNPSQARPLTLGQYKFKVRGSPDMHIFAHWHLTHEPALLIGMDVLGLLDVFIIDWRGLFR
jgi:hypothetical protein